MTLEFKNENRQNKKIGWVLFFKLLNWEFTVEMSLQKKVNFSILKSRRQYSNIMHDLVSDDLLLRQTSEQIT